MKYNLVVCGGTFDYFHKGHESFLRYVFSVGKKVVVGVTSNEYLKNSKFPTSLKLRGASKIQSSKLIEDFEKRKSAVLEFVKKEGVLDRVEIVKINDLFGPTLDKEFNGEAIVVSKDTKKGAEIINQKRKEAGFKELNLVVAPQVFAQDGKLVSAERIRNGEINRMGKLYINPLWLRKDLMLPENLRKEFKKPFGELLKDVTGLFKNKNNLVITVGDVTAKIFNEKSLEQNISVIDFKVAREKKFTSLKELGFLGRKITLKVENPAGSLTPSLFMACQKAWKEKTQTVIQVEGEEDLAVLPLVLSSPLGSFIFYGQPNQGLIRVEVSEDKKEEAYSLVSRFSTRGY